MDATLQARITTRPPTNGRRIISALGVAQIFAWGSSYYLANCPRRADCRRHGLASDLCRRRSLSGAAGFRIDLSQGWPADRRLGRPTRAFRRCCTARNRSRYDRIGTVTDGFPGGLGDHWDWHGRQPLRPGLFDPGTPLRGSGTPSDYYVDAVWRLRQHRVLADLRLVGRCLGLAWNLPRLCRRAARGLPAAHLVHSAE